MEGTEEVHVTASTAATAVTTAAAAAAAAVEGQREDDENDKTEERCPACRDGTMNELAGDKETWIQCDACKTWFHWDCAGNGGDAQQVDKWSVSPSPRFSFFIFFWKLQYPIHHSIARFVSNFILFFNFIDHCRFFNSLQVLRFVHD